MKMLLRWLAILGACVFSLSSHAQSTQLFRAASTLSPAEEGSILSVAERKQLQMHRDRKQVKAAKVVKIDLDALKFSSIEINIPGVPIRAFQATKFGSLDSAQTDFVGKGRKEWRAKGKNDEDATLVVDGDRIHGTIRLGVRLFEILPMEGGRNVLIEIDTTKLPSDHGPQPDKPISLSPTHTIAARPESGVLLQDFSATGSNAATFPTIDLLIAFTPQAQAYLGGAYNAAMVAATNMNSSLEYSAVNFRVRVVGDYQYYKDITDPNLALQDFVLDPGVKLARDYRNADVSILIGLFSGGVCGQAASIMSTAQSAYAVVGADCLLSNYSMAHEIGHLLGGRHEVASDPTNIPYRIGHGIWWILTPSTTNGSCWHTIMSYPVDRTSQYRCGSDPRINYWSNPRISYNYLPLGDPTSADMATVLNTTGPPAANFSNTKLSVGILPPITQLISSLFAWDQ